MKGKYHNSFVSKSGTVQCGGWGDHDIYCWSWFAGIPGTSNDINVLARAPLFTSICNETFDINVPDDYKIIEQGQKHHLPNFLVDGIYPHMPKFARQITNSEDENENKY